MPRRLTSDDQDFEQTEAFAKTRDFLEAWSAKNYGAIARFVSPLLARGKSTGQIAGEMRQAFDDFELSSFEINEVENSAPVIWVVKGAALVNGAPGTFQCRWVRQDHVGDPALGEEKGGLRLMAIGPEVWTRDQ